MLQSIRSQRVGHDLGTEQQQNVMLYPCFFDNKKVHVFNFSKWFNIYKFYFSYMYFIYLNERHSG